VPGSTFYATKAALLLTGRPLGSKPYLSLSGTSMSAPVVAGTVALMLQANPKLTPNLVKAILQYTAQSYPGYSSLRQGAGFLNTLGAVRLARFYLNPRTGDRMPTQSVWSRQILWGNHRVAKGVIKPAGSAWALDADNADDICAPTDNPCIVNHIYNVTGVLDFGLRTVQIIGAKVTTYTLGGLIHILLLLAVASVLIRVIQGRRPV